MNRKAQTVRRRKKVNLWPRRIVTGVGLLLIVGVIVWAIWALISMLVGGNSDSVMSAEAQQSSQSASEEFTPDGIVARDGTLTIPQCEAEDLNIDLSVANIAAGKGLAWPLKVTNTSKTACSTVAGGFAVKIFTGDVNVFDSLECTTPQEDPAKLLLRPGMLWEEQIAWDGNQYLGCKVQEETVMVTLPAEDASQSARQEQVVQKVQAKPGTYRLQLFRNGVQLGEDHVFSIE